MMYLIFYFSNHMFALPVENVLEIKKSSEITDVPLSPSYVEGIINLRGQIITAIHLAKKMNLKYEDGKNYYHVIIKNSDEPVSILVEEIGDVINIDQKDLEPVPDHLEGIDVSYVRNICKLSEGLLIILDPETIQK